MPTQAASGVVAVDGVGSRTLLIVPVITSFSNSDFRPSGTSRSLTLNGGGYIEGGTTVGFGAVSVADPGTGTATLDVFSGGTRLNVVIPESGTGKVTVVTAGGTSNAFAVGPTSFTGITATAEAGVPADGGRPSANVGQTVTLRGGGFGSNANVTFPTVNDSGLTGTTSVRVKSVSADGSAATVDVPNMAATGAVRVPGASGSFTLQVVPKITSFSNLDFRPSGTSRDLRLDGGGYIEGGTTVKFGAASVVDPDTGVGTLNVFSSGTVVTVVIPDGGSGSVTVVTAGGTSNAFGVGLTSFSGIAATAGAGVPADAAQPSANVGQTITVSGEDFRGNANVTFPTVDDSGLAGSTSVRVKSVSVGGGSATVTVPDGAATGAVSVPGASGSFTLQVVPKITSYTNSDFRPSGTSRNLGLNGGGFIEGGTTVAFGAVSVADPDTNSGTLDVYFSGTRLDVVIPDGGAGSVTVVTTGSTSKRVRGGPDVLFRDHCDGGGGRARSWDAAFGQCGTDDHGERRRLQEQQQCYFPDGGRQRCCGHYQHSREAGVGRRHLSNGNGARRSSDWSGERTGSVRLIYPSGGAEDRFPRKNPF